MAGDLAAAENSYRDLVSDGVDNRWLRGFYLRHQCPEFFECELDGLDPVAPVSPTMAAYDLVDLSVIYSVFRDYERAEEVSRILEDKGRFAYYAWLARYQRAVAEDDPVAAGEAREALCAMKISRPSHAAARGNYERDRMGALLLR